MRCVPGWSPQLHQLPNGIAHPQMEGVCTEIRVRAARQPSRTAWVGNPKWLATRTVYAIWGLWGHFGLCVTTLRQLKGTPLSKDALQPAAEARRASRSARCFWRRSGIQCPTMPHKNKTWTDFKLYKVGRFVAWHRSESQVSGVIVAPM